MLTHLLLEQGKIQEARAVIDAHVGRLSAPERRSP